MELWHVVVVAALAGTAGWCLWRRRAARPVSMSPVVYGLLQGAVEQGGYLSVEFPDQETESERFLGPCQGFDHRILTIDIGQDTEHPEWTGATVHVSFRLDHKKTTAYYQFITQVWGTKRERGSLSLLLHTPQEILSSQKRRFVRILPLREAIHGLGVWLIEDDAPRPSHPSELGRAPLHYRQGREGPLALVDISAAGLRLSLRREKDAPAPAVQAATRLLCLLMLHPAKSGTPLSFWLDCTVANILEQDDRLFFGLKFDAWATATSSKNFMEWSLAGENGWIGPLGTWVWHQQLTQVAQQKM